MKKTLPTFTNAPLSKLPAPRVALKMRLEELDKEHAQATTPARRRALEKKIAEARQALAAEEQAELEVAQAMWPEETRMELELRKLARVNPDVHNALKKYEATVDSLLKKPR